MEHHPDLFLSRQTDGHAGDAQLFDVVDRFDAGVGIPVGAVGGDDLPAVVHRVVMDISHHLRGVGAGGDVLRRQVVENVVREAQLQQLFADIRHLTLLRRVHRNPMHGVAPAEKAAAGAAGGKSRR